MKKRSERKKKYDDIEVMDLSNAREAKRTKPRAENKPRKKKKRGSINREFAVITYGFFVLFLALSGYFCYFLAFQAEDFINSPYNARLEQFASTTIRGDIYAGDGQTVLATSSVDTEGHESRSYPKGNIYAHSVGYAVNGMAGVELEGNFNLLRSHSFILKKLANDLQNKKNQGDSVVTTLVPSLQEAAYAGLGGYNGAVIAIEPSTGKILAMVSKPDFDPNTVGMNWESLSADSNSSVLLNRATQGLYPPGSTFKIITSLEYLREGGSTEDPYNCVGTYTQGETTIHCYHGSVHGQQNLTQAFGNSCNSVFAEIGLAINADHLTELSNRLMFNKKLPTSLKHVKSSRFELTNTSGDGLIMQSAIGQGNTLVTPLHMAMIAASIKNGGKVMRPYIIDRSVNDEGVIVKQYEPREYKKILTKRQAETLSEMMRYVVTNGTGSKLISESYTAYGKTGTAEFNANKDAHSWFVGFAENGEKEIAVAVIMEGAGSGSEFAVPLTRTLFDTYF